MSELNFIDTIYPDFKSDINMLDVLRKGLTIGLLTTDTEFIDQINQALNNKFKDKLLVTVDLDEYNEYFKGIDKSKFNGIDLITILESAIIMNNGEFYHNVLLVTNGKDDKKVKTQYALWSTSEHEISNLELHHSELIDKLRMIYK